jgi:TetR/AcrR family transcriptional regulator, transcriptional repressor of bet genes
VPGVRAPEAERRRQIVAAALTVAARDRLDGLTVRNVAAEAGLSPGLVFHHLGDKRRLLLAVLDQVLVAVVPAVADDDGTSARDRLLGHIHLELGKLEGHRDLVELFLDFWVVGTREPEVRDRIVAALGAYRRALRPLAESAIAGEPERFDGVDADRLASVVVAFAQGLAVQAVLDPAVSDPDATIAALEALIPPSSPGAG